MLTLPENPMDFQLIPCWVVSPNHAECPQEHRLVFRKHVKLRELLEHAEDAFRENVWVLYERVPGQPDKFCYFISQKATLNTFFPSLRAALMYQLNKFREIYLSNLRHCGESLDGLVNKLNALELLSNSEES